MKHTHTFEAPKIIGIISDRTVPSKIQKKIDRYLRRRHQAYVCLPFKIEPKYLKNVIACMRIMDVAGLIVTGRHTRRIGAFIPRLDTAAEKTGVVNVISKRRNSFIGRFVEDGPRFYDEAVGILISV